MPDAHEGHVSWERFEAIRTMVSSNVPTGRNHGAPKHSDALLAGLIRCKRCGRKLTLWYSGLQHGIPRYSCSRAWMDHGGPHCIAFGGLRVDDAIEEALLGVVGPGAVAAATAAAREAGNRRDQARDEIPAAPELIEALGMEGCLFTLDAEHCQKNLWARDRLGNHLLTQVKGNQPSLRRKLELGSAARKPSGSARSATSGRNRWETRELTVFPAKAWFRGSPWDGLRASAGAHGLQARPQDRTLQANGRDRLLGFLGFRPNARALERMDPGSLADRERQPLRARRSFRRGRFAHSQEPRHRRPLALFRLQHDQDCAMPKCPQRPLARRPGYQL